jgi:hypothetical protein
MFRDVVEHVLKNELQRKWSSFWRRWKGRAVQIVQKKNYKEEQCRLCRRRIISQVYGEMV